MKKDAPSHDRIMLVLDVTNHGLSDQIMDDIGIKYQTKYFSTPKRMNNAQIDPPKAVVKGQSLVTLENDEEREDNVKMADIIGKVRGHILTKEQWSTMDP